MSPSTNPLDYAPCRVPLRRVSAFDISFVVHEGMVGDTMEADRRWRGLGGKSFFLVRQADTGSYNCRNSVGHSRGVAIDFDWNDQPMVPKRTPCPQLPGMRAFYEQCWKPLGYGWGALWNSKCDAMHISKLRSEGGNGVLYQTWHGQEEDELTDEEKGKLEFVYQAVKRDGPDGKPEGIDKWLDRRLREILDAVLAEGGSV